MLPLPAKRTPLSRVHYSRDMRQVWRWPSPYNSLQRESRTTRKEHGEEVRTNCTSVCKNPNSGGVSCSKIVLVDVFTENGTQEPYRVYAIIDDQSNVSMISPKLADKLGATGPKLTYLLSTCSGTTEEKSGRRVCGVVLR